METTPKAPDLENEQIDIEALQIERRTAIVDEWLAAVSHVAQRSGVAAAEEAADFLATRAALGVARPVGGILQFRPPGSEFDASHHVFMTPLLDIDHGRLTAAGDWRRAMAGREQLTAKFTEGNQAIYFDSTASHSRTAKGLTMLHETVHAMTEIIGSVDRSAPGQYWAEEVEAYRLEYEVMAALGGEAYKKLVEHIADIIGEAEKDEDGRIEIAYTFSADDFETIGRIFDPQTNDDEISVWANVMLDNAWLLFFERHFEQPMEGFADFLAQKYGD